MVRKRTLSKQYPHDIALLKEKLNEQPLYRDAVVRVAAQAVAGFGGIGDQATALVVGGDAAIGDGNTMQAHLSD